MSNMFQPGTRIQLTGLVAPAVAHLNGVEAVVEKYSSKRVKYKVVLPLQGPVMVSEENMQVVGVSEGVSEGVSGSAPISGGKSVFRGEEDMMESLKSMGLSAEQLSSLTPEQRKAMLAMTMRPDIVDRAKNTPGVVAASTELTMEAGGLYGWRDAKTHVYLEMSLDKVEGGAQCQCHIEENNIRITSVSSGVTVTLLEGELFQSVDVTKCAWEEMDGKLVATLTKAKPMRWLMVIRS
jgi:hypothetical protein